MNSLEDFLEVAKAIHDQAVRSLFDLFEGLCEGAIAVDGEARIVWINRRIGISRLIGASPVMSTTGLS